MVKLLRPNTTSTRTLVQLRGRSAAKHRRLLFPYAASISSRSCALETIATHQHDDYNNQSQQIIFEKQARGMLRCCHPIQASANRDI